MALSVWAVSTSATQKPTPDGKVQYELKGPLPIRVPWGLDIVALRIPEDNPILPEKVELGKLLFFDRRLSADGKIAGVYLPPPVLPTPRIKSPESEIEPLRLSKGEKRDLVEFLKSLSGEGWQHIEPPVQFPQ